MAPIFNSKFNYFVFYFWLLLGFMLLIHYSNIMIPFMDLLILLCIKCLLATF
jgi:hypothetical protein